MEKVTELQAKRDRLAEIKARLEKELPQVQEELAKAQSTASSAILKGANPDKLAVEMTTLINREKLIAGALGQADRELAEATNALQSVKNEAVKLELARLRAGQESVLESLMATFGELEKKIADYLQQEESILKQVRGLYPDAILILNTRGNLVQHLASELNKFKDRATFESPNFPGTPYKPSPDEMRRIDAQGTIARSKEQIKKIDKKLEDKYTKESERLEVRKMDWQKNLKRAEADLK
jgi:chromosome segregation ATPase